MAVVPNKILAYGRNPNTNRPEPVFASDDGTALSVDDTYLRRYETVNDPRSWVQRAQTSLLSATRPNLSTSANDPLFMYNKAVGTLTFYVQHIHVHVSSASSNKGTVVVEVFRLKNLNEGTIGHSVTNVRVFNGMEIDATSAPDTAFNQFDIIQGRITNGTLNTSSNDVLFKFAKNFYGSFGTDMDVLVPLEHTQLEVVPGTGVGLRVSFSNSSQTSTISASIRYAYIDPQFSNNTMSNPVTSLDFLEDL